MSPMQENINRHKRQHHHAERHHGKGKPYYRANRRRDISLIYAHHDPPIKVWVRLLETCVGESRETLPARRRCYDVANLPASEIGNIIHPPFVVADREADRYEFDLGHHGVQRRWERHPVGWFVTLPRRVARTGYRWWTGRKL